MDFNKSMDDYLNERLNKDISSNNRLDISKRLIYFKSLIYKNRIKKSNKSSKSFSKNVTESGFDDELINLKDGHNIHILNKKPCKITRLWNDFIDKIRLRFSGRSNVLGDEALPQEATDEEVLDEIKEVKKEVDEIKNIREKESDEIRKLERQEHFIIRMFKNMFRHQDSFDENDISEDAGFRFEDDEGVYAIDGEDSNAQKKRIMVYKAKLNHEMADVLLMFSEFLNTLSNEQKHRFTRLPDFPKYKKFIAIAKSQTAKRKSFDTEDKNSYQKINGGVDTGDLN